MRCYLEGKPIVDATESVLVQVSSRDAAGADVREPTTCAVAVACKRGSLKDSALDVQDARIHLSRAYLLVEGRWLRYLVSDKFRENIIAFDQGGGFRAGVYRLKVLPASKPSKRSLATKPAGRPEVHARVKRQYHIVSGVRPRSPV